MAAGTRYIPALRFDWLTPVYDPVLRRMMPEVALKQWLIAQAQIAAGQRVLDLGAGTLTVMIKQARPSADVVGLDGDPKVLAIAREKATALAWRSASTTGWQRRYRMMTPRLTASCPA